MLKIGCHLSVFKGFSAMGEDALAINVNTFQFFTRNPRVKGYAEEITLLGNFYKAS
jgi:endonuclease IV